MPQFDVAAAPLDWVPRRTPRAPLAGDQRRWRIGDVSGSSKVGRLWQCPACGRTFANRNQTHTCRRLGDLDAHFAGCSPDVRATFDRILEVLAELGPVEVLAEKTRIALHVRMSFAALMPRKAWLNGHLVLARRVDSPRFAKVEVYSPRNVLHAFRLRSPDEVDEEFAGWLAEAYWVGEQRHLQ